MSGEEQQALVRRIVERYAPRRQVVIRVEHELVRVVERRSSMLLGPIGGMVYRERLRLLWDIPADLVDRAPRRWWHRRAPRAVNAVVRVPTEVEITVEVLP